MSLILFIAGLLVILFLFGVALVILSRRNNKKYINRLPKDERFWEQVHSAGGKSWDGDPLVVDDFPMYDLSEINSN